MNTVEAVRAAVGAVVDPELRRGLGELEMIAHVRESDSGISVGVRLTIVGCPASSRIEREVREAAESAAPGREISVELSVMTPEQRSALIEKVRGGHARGNPFTADSLTRVICVTSGKGGVGKSTVTVNLAVALADTGLNVGLIDADVHGFSVPRLTGLSGAKPTRVGELIMPPEAYGVRVMSIGMFLEDDAQPVAWRGPMLHRTISQFLSDVYFGDLDVLLLDLPPGTGDIAISIGQLLPHAEVLVVTTPETAAAEVAERSGRVARQTGQRVRGVVENMAGLTMPDGTIVELFGAGGGARVAERLSEEGAAVPLLGSVPLSPTLATASERGEPIVRFAPEDPAAQALLAVAAQLSTRVDSLSGKPLGLHPR